MVLSLKRWKSRSSPGIAAGARARETFYRTHSHVFPAFGVETGAGWSSPVARQAHNLKVAGSNPAPATNKKPALANARRAFCLSGADRFRLVGLDEPECPHARDRRARRSCILTAAKAAARSFDPRM